MHDQQKDYIKVKEINTRHIVYTTAIIMDVPSMEQLDFLAGTVTFLMHNYHILDGVVSTTQHEDLGFCPITTT